LSDYAPALRSGPRRPALLPLAQYLTIVIVWLVFGLVTNQHYEWSRFRYWFAKDVVLRGLKVTLVVTGWSALFGFIGGILSANPVMRALSGCTSGFSGRCR
jgi:polar amino acid transport system permease protein